MLASISLPRGGAITFDYSLDGAKDLTSINWPEMTSGQFTIAGTSTGFGYDLAGNVRSQTDPSGTRSVDYLNGRLSGTTYTAGLLNGYQILRALDGFGRQTGTTLNRDGQTIHSTATTPDGLSDQILDLASGGITATPQRDAAGDISGYVWSDGGANTVTQTWTRGPGGRIETAGSDVPGAPAFDYLIDPLQPEESFDAFGRRLKCETAGGIWTYQYGTGGQLTSATHPSLGSFTYAFDGIGRRTDQGTANTTDILNRTTAWTHDQNKTITIQADPNARVWFNGTEVTGFSGSHQEAVTPPGPEGGWATYDVLAILENAGDGFGDPAPNPLASPDAKAEQSGAVWVPPAAETLTYDAAGNRQSSALWDYGWNAKNQLTRIRTKDFDAATTPQAYDLTFAYDSEGRRIKKHVVELQNGDVVAEKTVLYVWDGWDLLYERHQLPSGLTTLERKYLWGPDIADGKAGGAGGLLLIQETKGDTTTEIIPLYDGTGHVVALTDIEKNLLATYAYGPFGEKIAASGPRAQNNPWRWATKYLDEETGLYYFGQRYFDPVTGQWLSREPLGESESVNLYVYAGNDPINHVDVLGLSAQKIDEISQQLGPFAFDNPDNLELLFELRRKLQDNDFRITQTRERLGLNNVGIFLGSDGAIVLGQDNTYLIDFAPRNYASSQNAWNEAGFFGRMGLLFTDEIPALYRRSVRNSALGLEPAPWLTGPVLDSSYTALSYTTGGMGSFWIPTLRGDYETAQNDLKYGAFELAAAPLVGLAARPILRTGGRSAFRSADNIVASKGGATFEGTIYRSPYPNSSPRVIDDFNIAASHRYSAPGEGALYFSTNQRTVIQELGGSYTGGRNMFSFDVKLDNLLDLSNPSVRSSLGVSLDDIIRTGSGKYDITHPLGSFAREQGFSGIIAPSARSDAGLNLILFQAP